MQVKDECTEERRSCKRIRKLYLVSYINKEEGRQVTPVLMGRTLDISSSGVRVEVFQKINVNSEMELDIACDDTNISVNGQVKHSSITGHEVFVLGIKFDEIKPELEPGPTLGA